MRKGDPIDPAVGLELRPEIGDRVEPGLPVAIVHARDDEGARVAADRIRASIGVSDRQIEPSPLVLGWHGGRP